MGVVCVDLDGTLIDSAPDLTAATNRVLAERGLPAVSESVVRARIGGGARALIRRVLAHLGAPPGDEHEAGRQLVEAYLGALTVSTRCFPGAHAALTAVRDDGHRLALTTNKPGTPTARLLEHFALGSLFDVVLAGDTLDVKKPDPRHLTEAVARCGGGPALLVGDSRTDAAAAAAAGYPFIAVSFGYSTEPVAALGAVRIIDHLDALPEAVRAVMPCA
ncbi:MAG: phosphoglycolate phosphatase [Myxococcota bacterium]|jgi:phosphoglycolate phosphatase